MKALVLIAAAAIVLADAPPPDRRGCPVAGNYRVAGTNPGGGDYEGTATIRAQGGECHVYWAPPNESEGAGTYANGKLTVHYRMAAGVEGGVVTYARQANGVLQGTWSLYEGGGVGTETLTPN
jgi:hypothetical protein